ncbi:atrioventricular node cell differentiation [Mactra antiquata]
MGDYMSPKRKDVVDRLRRRIELYRRRQTVVQQRYEYGQKPIYDQQKQHALSLRQMWLESKAKKASKSKSKSSDTNNSDHRNQIVAKRLKVKLDNNSIENQQQQQQQQQPPQQPANHPENVYRFDDDDTPGSAKTHTTSTSNSTIETGISSSVSVHIVHQINGGNSQNEQKISTNVTVNQTIKPQSETETDVQTNVECKQEPSEESKNQSGSSNNNNKNNNNCDNSEQELDESDLVEILMRYREGGEDIPVDLRDELDIFEEICQKFKSDQDSEENDSSVKTPDSSGNMFPSNMYIDPNQGPGQVRTPPFRGNQTHNGLAMSEGSLAAEALKQMAAQHQQHHPGQEQFGVKSAVDPFSDLSDTGNFARNGYSQQDYYNNMQNRAGSAGSYPNQPAIGYQTGKQTLPSFGPNNKQMTHFAHNTPSTQADTGPSSLQQLQNQVAHFNQGPQMEITQTQHMQVSDGSHRMQMSQTQHVQLRQPFPNISLTQQQGFSASPPNVVPNTSNASQTQTFMPNDQMSLQQQQLLQQQNKMHSDPRQAQMQQYMNRPPPEYKMQHNSMNGAMASNSMGPNPLQTMQNMVNQANTHPNQAYPSVKSEASDMQNGIRSAQMTAMQQQQQGVGMSMSQAQMNYSNQSMQRQASYPGAMSHHMTGRPPRPQNAPTYTSAMMRNQRPPNVNIGPDGLNISQPIVGNPRHPQDVAAAQWPRAMNPMSGHSVRQGSPSTSAGMMQYRSYSSDGHSASASQIQMHHQSQRSMHMDSMQSQQQASMMQHSGTHPQQQQQQMMMQQQRMQMSQQQMNQTRQTPPYGMGSQQGSNFPQSSSSQEDFLNLLDTTPNQSTDFFDVQTSDANWCDIEEILGNPK